MPTDSAYVFRGSLVRCTGIRYAADSGRSNAVYLNTLPDKQPGQMQAWVGQGRLAEAAGDFSGAIAAVQKVIDIFDARFAVR